jgi:hypothetical protein
MGYPERRKSGQFRGVAALYCFAAALLCCTPVTVLTADATSEAQIPLQLREDWAHGAGFDGELSVQVTALYHGIWVGQGLARALGGGEQLRLINSGAGDDGSSPTTRNDLGAAVDALGLQYQPWQAAGSLGDFLAWTFEKIATGWPVIMSARVKGGAGLEYDHIMPAYGYAVTGTAAQFCTLACHQSPGPNAVD